MGMRIYPTRDDLAIYPKIFKWTVLSLAALLFLAALARIGFVFVPALVDGTVSIIVNSQTKDDLSTYLLITDAVELGFLPYSQPIVRLTDIAENRPLESSDLDSLAGMPDVVDAFYIDYDQGSGFAIKQTLPVAKLMERLDLNGIGTLPPVHGIGLRHLSTDHGDYVLLVRYFGRRVPRQAKGVIGAVMDRRKTIAGMPSLLDSLLANSSYFLINKPTMGLLDGRDTLWWHGDRRVEIISPRAKDFNPAKGKYEGMGGNISGLDIKLLVKTELPIHLYILGKDKIYQRIPVKRFQVLPKLVLFIELLLVAALIVVVIQIRIARRRKKAA